MKDFFMSNKLLSVIFLGMFLLSFNFLQASDEDDFVMVAETETTPLLQEGRKNIVYYGLKDDTVQRTNPVHSMILSHLYEHGVDDKTDTLIECLYCCCPVFKNCFGGKK